MADRYRVLLTLKGAKRIEVEGREFGGAKEAAEKLLGHVHPHPRQVDPAPAEASIPTANALAPSAMP